MFSGREYKKRILKIERLLVISKIKILRPANLFESWCVPTIAATINQSLVVVHILLSPIKQALMLIWFDRIKSGNAFTLFLLLLLVFFHLYELEIYNFLAEDLKNEAYKPAKFLRLPLYKPLHFKILIGFFRIFFF